MYGKLPRVVTTIFNLGHEMMFYQDMPIKMQGETGLTLEKRLITGFGEIISTVCCDFVGQFGLNRFVESNVYVCAKRMYQDEQTCFNRKGWHTDGYGTSDITYLWSDSSPTVFNCSSFKLSEDDSISMLEMEAQAQSIFDTTYPNNTLLQVDQYVVHKVNSQQTGVRSFLKVIFSKDKFDRVGNSHNYMLQYDWKMVPRSITRNTPQSNTN